MHSILCRFLILSLSVSIAAATHSAWSSGIPWDAVSAVAAPVPVLSQNHEAVLDISGKGAMLWIHIKPGFIKSSASIEIFNTAGMVMAKISQVSSNNTKVQISDDNGKLIPAGIYVARMKIGQTLYKKEFILSR
jgi:hypothetical protein